MGNEVENILTKCREQKKKLVLSFKTESDVEDLLSAIIYVQM